MFPLAAVTISLTTVFGILGLILGLVGLPILGIVVVFLLFRRTASQPSQSPPVDFLNTKIDLGILNGLFAAIRSNDRQKMLIEIELLARRAGEEGGMEAILEAWLYRQLEKKLNDPHARTPVLTALARVLKVNERHLLDLLEGRITPPPPAPVMSVATLGQVATQLPQATAVVAKLLVFAVLVVGASAASAAPPLRSPERFEPTESAAVVDPPRFHAHTLRPGMLAPNAESQVQPQTGHATYWYQPVTYWQPRPVARAAYAPVRWLGWVFRCR